MNERMIYLAALIIAAQTHVPQIYSQKFRAAGNTYLSPTEKIRVDELADHFVVAGIVGRNEVLPILGKDGFSKLEFEPDVIGGQFAFSASDIIQLQAGVPTYTKDGTVLETVQALEAKYAKMAKAAIENKFERQCADVYLKGSYTSKDGEVIYPGTKDNAAITLKGKVVSDELIKIALTYKTKNGTMPKIELGMSVFNALKNEANNSQQNINGVKFNFGDTPTLTIGDVKIEMLEDAKGSDGKIIDTTKMIILSNPSTLAIGYGCLQYGDIKTNESKIVKSELAAGELRVEETTGQKGLWAKSAPMPVVLATSKFVRYAATL